MAKKGKADTKGTDVPPTPEVVSDTSKKVTKTPRTTKAKVSACDKSADTKVEETTTEVVSGEVDKEELVLTETFSQFLSKLQLLASQMNALKTEFRLLEKKATRELKAAHKINAKRKRKSGNRSPSGFVKPTLISDELAKFLQKPSGTEMARTEVTREINGYIRSHNLQDKQNGRKINPDTELATLLKIGSNEELTYFNLQRYMSPHFAKANAKPAAN
jgi:chromatin remodeling complex protein RSC6